MSRPKLDLKEGLRLARELREPAPGVPDLFLLGIRGYYRDSMGEPGKNDYGLYDDAICIIGTDCLVAFNANCDPSKAKRRPDGRGMAVLKAGIWSYQLGIHRGAKSKYPALVQACDVTIRRVVDGAEFDSGGGVEDTGRFGINIHRGGQVSTGSEGCQTIPADQWASFYTLVKARMTELGMATIDYVLVDWHSAKGDE